MRSTALPVRHWLKRSSTRASKPLSPLPSAQRREGWGGVLSAATAKPQAKANPLPTSPLATPKGRSQALPATAIPPPLHEVQGRVGEECSSQQPQSFNQKPTPSQPPPWLRQRGGAKPAPLQAWRKTLRTLSAPTSQLHGFPATSSPFPASAAWPPLPAAGACSVSIPHRPGGNARGCADRCPGSSGFLHGG